MRVGEADFAVVIDWLDKTERLQDFDAFLRLFFGDRRNYAVCNFRNVHVAVFHFDKRSYDDCPPGAEILELVVLEQMAFHVAQLERLLQNFSFCLFGFCARCDNQQVEVGGSATVEPEHFFCGGDCVDGEIALFLNNVVSVT